MKLNIYVLSDSIGNTGEQIARVCLAQYNDPVYEIKKFPYVTNSQIDSILEEASLENSMIIYSTVDIELNKKIIKYSEDHNIPAFDIIGDIINTMAKKFDAQPKREAGIIRQLNKTYFNRVEAIEFAVKYDDGKDPRGIKKADVVLLGISRTSKTPLSMYLANKNIKVANIPLVPESMPPREIYEIPSNRIIGLINSPEKLNQIREERLKALGLGKGSNYSSLARILEELDYAEKIMKKIGCPIIDVSNKAIEETAEIIISILKKQGITLLKN